MYWDKLLTISVTNPKGETKEMDQAEYEELLWAAASNDQCVSFCESMNMCSKFKHFGGVALNHKPVIMWLESVGYTIKDIQ